MYDLFVNHITNTYYTKIIFKIIFLNKFYLIDI